MHACFCVGPQNGDPVCPCRMRNVVVRNGHYIEEHDLGEAVGSRNARLLRKALSNKSRKVDRQWLLDEYHRRAKRVTDRGGVWGAIPPVSETF